MYNGYLKYFPSLTIPELKQWFTLMNENLFFPFLLLSRKRETRKFSFSMHQYYSKVTLFINVLIVSSSSKFLGEPVKARIRPARGRRGRRSGRESRRRDKVYRPTNDTDFAPTKISPSGGIRYRGALLVRSSFLLLCVWRVGFARF